MAKNQRDIRIKRMRYQSWHRGCKETDLLLGQFADTALEQLDAVGLDGFERLLGEEDYDIWQWVSGQRATPEPYARFIASMGKK